MVSIVGLSNHAARRPPALVLPAGENTRWERFRGEPIQKKNRAPTMRSAKAMFTQFAWQEPSPDVGLACRRYLLRRRDCLEPIADAARDHPDVAALVAALTRFATDGILIKVEARPWRPLLHYAFDRAWQFHATEFELDLEHGPNPARRIAPRESFIVTPLIRILGHSMAGLRLRSGPALWLPQTGEPLLDWLARQPGRPSLHREPVTLLQRRRLAWRLYSQMVPEGLRSLLDTAEAELAASLLMQDPDHSSEQRDLN